MNSPQITHVARWLASAFVGALAASTAIASESPAVAAAATEIRPFKLNVPQAALDDLRKRVRETRWTDKETVDDSSQGPQLATVQALVQYWGTQYDWRKTETRLKSLPQFTTNIDGVDIHFIHVRSKQPHALPVLITHGWPGSFLEMVSSIDPLTNPTAHGGRAEDAFDVVIPSMPGYGFSGRPVERGWDVEHIARAWTVLMQRLGYTHYVAQGGDWGSPVSGAMARQAAPGLAGIHLNLPATVPNEIAAVLAAAGPAPAGLSPSERAAFDALDRLFKTGRGYLVMMGSRPQTVGYGLADSPAGLAGWLIDHDPHSYRQVTQAFEGHPVGGLTRDAILDNITLYWLTNTATSAARLYWENAGKSAVLASAQKTGEIKLPVAITVFPDELYRAPESWARRAYPNLIYFHETDQGGHFAAWEQPELFAAELRAAFSSLRTAH